MNRKRTVMSYRLFKDLIDKIFKETNQYNVVSFAGIGEPLFDFYLEDKIKYIKRKYPHVHIPMVTNGSLLSITRFRSLQEAGLDILRVSFHGGNRKSYMNLHQVDDFYRTSRTIEIILDHKFNIKTKIALTFAMVKGINDKSIEAWKNKWIRPDIWLSEIWTAHNWTTAFKFRKEQDIKKSTCGRVFKAPLQIQVDGTVNMCCFDYDGKLLLGDLKYQSLKEIFSDKAFEYIAKYHTTGNFENSDLICEHCDQRNENKSESLIFSSRFKNKEDRITKSSTAYKPII